MSKYKIATYAIKLVKESNSIYESNPFIRNPIDAYILHSRISVTRKSVKAL